MLNQDTHFGDRDGHFIRRSSQLEQLGNRIGLGDRKQEPRGWKGSQARMG